MNNFEVLRGEESWGVLNGTSLRTFVEADYYDLKEIFGEPSNQEEGEKVSNEWIIDFGDGYLSIYDWKYYNSQRAIMHCSRWHIGGKPEHIFEANKLAEYITNKIKAKIYDGNKGLIMPDSYKKALKSM